MSIFEDEMIYI